MKSTAVSFFLFTFSIFLIPFSFSPLSAQHAEQKYYPETDPLVLEKLEQWQDMKFGLLMHWGAYSQWGIVESWSICAEDEGWCRRKSDNYTEYIQVFSSKFSFVPNLSIIDLLFNLGPETIDYLKNLKL